VLGFLVGRETGKEWWCWKSLGSDSEITAAQVTDSRPLLKVHYARARHHFLDRPAPPLGCRNAVECSAELRPYRDPAYELQKLEDDVPVQAVPEMRTVASQTPCYRKVDFAAQADPEAVTLAHPSGEENPSIDSGLACFLERVLPRVEYGLTQNECVAVFQDDYAAIEDDDAFVGHQDETGLKENQSFLHHSYTKGRRVNCIDWQPKTSKVVAISLSEAASVSDRAVAYSKVQTSFVVIWSFSDPLQPQVVLEAPDEVAVIRFHPTCSQWLVGGCTNGQVVLWDLSKVQAKAKGRKGDRGDSPTHGGRGGGGDGPPTLRWEQFSRVETGHRRAVSDLGWLPDAQEANFDGHLSRAPGDTGTHQFLTLGADGVLLLWDIRREHVRRDLLRKAQQEAARSADGELPWVPLLKIPLPRPDGGGDVAGLRMQLTPTALDPYRVCCTSEDGELCFVRWAPSEGRRDAPLGAEPAAPDRTTPIQQAVPAHYGPATGVQRHPLADFADYYLTVGDWCFKVWCLGTPEPLVTSPSSLCGMTCARWSPTRPSLVYVGTQDGYLQVWDLLERLHEPALTQSVCPGAVSFLEFRPVGDGRGRFGAQMLAAGDEHGVLHIFEIPRTFIRPHAHEAANTERFLRHEARRVDYFAGRWRTRQLELEQLQAQMEREKLEAPIPGTGDENGAALGEEANPFADDLLFKDALLEFQATLDTGPPTEAFH